VTNDRVLTRGFTTVHINAGPRYVPGAAPRKLMAVAPQAFPQRAILPQRGVNMAERPWIRAASGDVVRPAGAGGEIRGRAGIGVGQTLGRGAPARVSAPTPPRIYNPPRAFASTAPAQVYAPSHAFATPSHAFAPSAPASAPPRGYGAAAMYGSPHAHGIAPAGGAPRVYGPPTPTYSAPAAGNFPRVYSPPPRPFAQPPAQRPPAQTFHQAYTPAPAQHFSQPHNFVAPSPGGFGGGGAHFGGGGGAHFGGGGGHRR